MSLEFLFFISGIIALGISIIISVGQIIAVRLLFRRKTGGLLGTSVSKPTHVIKIVVLVLTIISFILVTCSIISRAIVTGHGPFSSMYEFSLAFSWGILVMTLFFSCKYNSAAINCAGMIIAFGLLLFANTLPSRATPLVPALQQSFLLSGHVVSAMIAYGAFTVGFIASVFYMFQKKERLNWLPSSESLENISYHAVMIGFPFMTLVIVLGAFWADIAWGRYWGWDPKETASLVTWLIYAGYLHARILRGWRGKKTALLLIVGFAAVIFTFFGNYIFSGLHSYT